ncbi:MAG: SagB/ThcOx family dehydrogenase [Candidatus Micrarchaeia archaeon]
MAGEVKKMDWFLPATLAFLAILAAYFLPTLLPRPFLPAKHYAAAQLIELPRPARSNISFEDALLARRSVRDYTDESISPSELAALLFAAQGMSGEGKRTAPSAGALYPLELYVLVSRVEGIAPGAYHYNSANNSLELVAAGDYRERIARAAADQPWVGNAAVVVVFAALMHRTTAKYGARGVQYVWIEAGHASQNLLLQAAALGLGAVPIGAFNEDEVRHLLNLSADEEVIYLNIVGRPA